MRRNSKAAWQQKKMPLPASATAGTGEEITQKQKGRHTESGGSEGRRLQGKKKEKGRWQAHT